MRRAAETGEPTSVIVLGYRRAPVVKLAHASCADSQVMAVDADRPDSLAFARFSDMLSKSALMEYATPPKFRSLLVLEPRVELSEPTAGGDVVNLWISGMIDNGLTLMRTGGQLPDRPGNWELDLLGSADARLTAPGGLVIYEGGCSQPGDWVEVIHEVGGCVVLIGTVGLYSVPDDNMTPRLMKKLLNQAARNGQLAGGLIKTYSQGPANPLAPSRPQDDCGATRH